MRCRCRPSRSRRRARMLRIPRRNTSSASSSPGLHPFEIITIEILNRLLRRNLGRDNIIRILNLLQRAVHIVPMSRSYRHAANRFQPEFLRILPKQICNSQPIEFIHREFPLLYDNIVKHLFLIRLAQYIRLDRKFRNESVNVHIASLSDSVTSILTLLVHRGIPIQIVENDGIGTGQVETQPARTRRQDEHQNAVIIVEPFRQDLPLLDFCSTVQSKIPMAVNIEKLFEDIQNLGHLREYQRSVSTFLQVT
ncbi:hypothetical protein AA313_de0207706 [Arthrobotrys entomopaga]|nr:hypothetical protein AA313_de0207706 [Arthrobotrys entomopaga]